MGVMYSWAMPKPGGGPGGGSASSGYSTTFPLTENPISEGGIWLTGGTDGLDWIDIQTTPGKMLAAAIDSAPGGVKDGNAQLKRSFLACASDQFSEGVIFREIGYGGVSHECEVYCNMTITAHSITGYEAYFGIGNTHTLVRWNGAFGDFTPLAAGNVNASSEPADGDVIKIWRSGNTVFCSQNGVTISSAVDTTYMGGNPGLGNNPATGATIANYGLKSWNCGNL